MQDPLHATILLRDYAALLIDANAHPKLLQSRLGHTSIKTTLDIYGHFYDRVVERGQRGRYTSLRCCTRWIRTIWSSSKIS